MGTRKALIRAAKRGVDIEVIVPGEEIAQAVVRSASRARWGELLAAGITIFEYEPTMFHTKLFIVELPLYRSALQTSTADRFT